jgi:hypothetical protein
MLAPQQLPPLVRSKIIEYGKEKAAGLYGGCGSSRLYVIRGPVGDRYLPC